MGQFGYGGLSDVLVLVVGECVEEVVVDGDESGEEGEAEVVVDGLLVEGAGEGGLVGVEEGEGEGEGVLVHGGINIKYDRL